MTTRLQALDFTNFGVLMANVPEEVKNELLPEIEWMEKNFDKCIPVNNTLAGQIRREYKVTKNTDLLKRIVLQLVQEYDNRYGYIKEISMLTSNLPLTVNHVWVNFQAKHEFNPVHNHNGLMSFVVWVKIPYDLEKERLYGPGQFSHSNMTSDFQFLYSNSLGNITTHQLNVDKSFEFKIALFPAKMMHCVYPFYTSDEYRISVAGNVMLQA